MCESTLSDATSRSVPITLLPVGSRTVLVTNSVGMRVFLCCVCSVCSVCSLCSVCCVCSLCCLCSVCSVCSLCSVCCVCSLCSGVFLVFRMFPVSTEGQAPVLRHSKSCYFRSAVPQPPQQMLHNFLKSIIIQNFTFWVLKKLPPPLFFW